MADSNSTCHAAAAPATADTIGDLIVVIRHDGDICEYRGTRAQLEAEGVIPDGTSWPDGYDDLRWQAGKFDFWLRRHRPEGAKGTRRQFADFDWWHLRWEPSNQPSFGQRLITRKARELADTIYRQSAQWQAEWYAAYKRHNETIKDEKFQAFKALVPGLVPPKRGRRPNSKL